ncbi:MAG: type II secretion system F family protein [Alphaproteobacteria bacterium]
MILSASLSDYAQQGAGFAANYLVIGGAGLFIVILIIGVIGLFSRQDTAVRRMRRAGQPANTGGPALTYGGSENSLFKALRPVSRFLEPRSRTDRLALAKMLLRAGFYDPGAVNKYLASRIICVIACPVPMMLLGRMALGMTSTQNSVILLGLGAVAGYYLPRMIVYHFVQKRQETIMESFPEALDMLLICVASGSSLTAAFQRVGQEFREVCKPLSDEFRYMTLELQAGISRSESFRNLADRIDLPEVNTLVSLLIQSESLGASLSKTLRIHAEEMRKERINKAEEIANKLPVKISAVTALFILPCVFIVVLTPAAIQVMRNLLTAF